MSDKPSSKASLGKRALQSAGWVVTSNGAGIAIAFSSSLIMTRFLPPEAFGLIAAAAVLQAFALIVTDIGIVQSIVRESDGENEDFLRVAWTVQLIRSAAIAGVVLLIALGVYLWGERLSNPESVFAKPELAILVALFAGIAFLEGAVSSNWHVAERRLEFRKVSLIELGGQILGLVGAVVFVQFSPTVWALFFGLLITNLVKTGLSHIILSGPRMRIAFDREISGRLWGFGKWILGSSVLNYVAGQADKVFLGGGLAAGVFGVYAISRNILDAAQKIMNILSAKVGYAVLAEVCNSAPERLKEAFRKCDLGTTLLCVVAGLAGALLAVPFVKLVYPGNFHDAGLYLQLMAPSFLFLRFLVHNQLLLAVGNSRAFAVTAGIRAAAICIFVPLALKYYGVEGALVAAILARNSSVPYVIFLTGRILGRRQVAFDIFWLSLTVIILVFSYFSVVGISFHN